MTALSGRKKGSDPVSLNRRIITGILVSILIFSTTVSGCRKKAPDTFHYAQERGRFVPVEMNEDMQIRYRSAVSDLSEHWTGFSERVMLEEDMAVVFSMEKKTYYAFFSGSDPSQDSVHELDVPGQIHKFGRLNGRQTYVISSSLDSLYDVDYSVSVLDEKGEVYLTSVVPDFHNMLFSCSNTCADGSLVVSDGETLFYLDSRLQVKRKLSFGNDSIRSFAVNDKGEIGMVTASQNNDGMENYVLRICSSEGKKISEQEILTEFDVAQVFGQESGMKDDFFVSTYLFTGRITSSGDWLEQDVYNSISGSDSNQVADTRPCGTYISWIEDVMSIGDGQYRFCGYMMIMDSQRNGIFQVEYHKDDGNREEVTIAVVEPLQWSYIESLADYYNLIQNKYKIRVINYIDQDKDVIEQRQTAAARILSDMYSGQTPDMFYVSPGISRMLKERGDLYDMSPWTEDPAWPKEEFYPNVYAAMRNEEGMYMFSPIFTLYMMGGDSEIIKDVSRSGDLDYLSSLARQSGSALQGGMIQLFYPKIYSAMTGPERASEAETLDLIERCLQTYLSLKQEGLILGNSRQYGITRFLEVFGFQHFGQGAELFQAPMTPVLFPEMDISSYFMLDTVLSVSASSKHLDAAKELLFLMSTPMVQDNLSEKQRGIPIRKDCARRDVEKNTEEFSHFSTSGQAEDGMTSYAIDDVEACIDQYLRILEETQTYYEFDEQFISIITEEYSVLEARPTDLHEIAETMQSRLRLYVEENYEMPLQS